MIGGRLMMRAQLERDQATATDAWNQRVEPDFQPVGAPLACFVWSRSSREDVNSDRSAALEDLRGMFALGADLRAGDELVAVTDRLGFTVHFGRLKLEGPAQFKHTHLEVALRRIS